VPSPDPAATVILLRDVGDGFEVLMVERNPRGVFGSMFVFPGGRVDGCDVPDGHSMTDDESHRMAGIRELAEEAGILLTDSGAVAAPSLKGADLYGWVEDHGHTLAASELTLVSRWVTPEVSPRRFDTRFYLTAAENTPEVVIDGEELIGHRWVRPDGAISSHVAGEMNMILPTLAHLRWLARRRTTADAISSAQGADGRTLIRPEVREDGSLVPVHLPAEVM
jgi:8-oxo-dGTP pyrophosphatase MutT (NUDIX family)